VIQRHGLRWHEIKLRRKPRLVRDALSLPDLIRLYASVRPDLVHHIALKAVVIGTVAARLAGVPAVVNAITGLGYAFDEHHRYPFGPAVTSTFHFMRHPHSRFIFQNVEDREIFLRHGWSNEAQAVIIRGSGVDPATFFPPTRGRSGRSLVVFASRLLRSKGVAEFVEAARRLKVLGFDARFAVIGDADPESEDSINSAEVESWREAGSVEVWGPRNDMPAIFREASLCVLPTYYREGVPKVLIEASASGIPSITTDTPGCRDIIVDGETGLLVPPRDVSALTDGIAALLRDPDRRRLMGERARERFLSHFTLDRVITATFGTYEALLNDGAERPADLDPLMQDANDDKSSSASAQPHDGRFADIRQSSVFAHGFTSGARKGRSVEDRERSTNLGKERDGR